MKADSVKVTGSPSSVMSPNRGKGQRVVRLKSSASGKRTGWATTTTVRIRGNRILVHDAVGWGNTVNHPAVLRGEWDPAAGRGWVEFRDHAMARAVAVELVIDGYLEARE